MNSEELENWFEANKTLLENAYVAAQEPWQQSGVGLGGGRNAEYWEAIRRPIAECVDRSGTFLDIGCANGYLLECVMGWVWERGLEIVPYGLDISEKLAEMARQRLVGYEEHIFVGNAWDWVPTRKFDFVRTELVYVPEYLHGAYVNRLLEHFVEPGGKLLVAQYRGHGDNTPGELGIVGYLAGLGFAAESSVAGVWQGLEKTRVAVLQA